jgi:sugar (pentulose or hexulose) kinase
VEVALGIDIGTSSTKGLLVTPAGQVVGTAQRPHQISLPLPSWAEADAERTWWAPQYPYKLEWLAALRSSLNDHDPR